MDRFSPMTVDALIAAAGPEDRQAAVDTICAWLRSPDLSSEERRDVLRALTDAVRSWGSVDLDLSEATLTDTDFSGCHIGDAKFTDTRLHGTTRFDGATFDGTAQFQRAVFHGDTRFDGARFGGDAEFGRTRFRGRADFGGAAFAGMAWFGRGTDTWWDDDEAWDTVEEIVPAPWDEPNEHDPDWPVAVLIEDYQDWEEGGDGARFGGDVSFRAARFEGPAWFHYARFAAAASFAGAWFGGRVHLDQPVVDLGGAHWTGNTDHGPSQWTFGWAVDSGGDLVPDASVRPYARQLADRDPLVRAAGLEILGRLGDERPELRQRIVLAVCALLREPVGFDLRAGSRTAEQDAELRLRDEAQRRLASWLRQWPGLYVLLCGATLVDLDLRGCAASYADFIGTQFHGTTRLDDTRFKRTSFSLDGYHFGKAAFHGDVVFDGEPPTGVNLLS